MPSGTIPVLLTAGTTTGRRLKAAAKAAAYLSSALGLTVMLGWRAGVHPLIQVLPNRAPMQFNTALGFFLCGAALHLAAQGRGRLAVVVSALPAIVGLLTLFEYWGEVDLGIDRLLLEPHLTVKTRDPGRMSSSSAFSFFLVWMAMAALRWWRKGAGSGLLGATVAALGFGTLIGYPLGGETPYGWGHPTYMAIHTAAGFSVLGAGIVALAWRQSGVRMTSAPRWLAIAVSTFLVMVALGLWQAVKLFERRPFEETRVPLVTLLVGLSTALLVGLLIDRARAARQREEKFRILMELAPHANVAVDTTGAIVMMNAKAERILGYKREELIGLSVDVLVPDRFREIHPRHRQDYLRTPEARGLGGGRTLYALRRDGREFPADVTLSPVWGDEGLLVIAAIIDISERVELENKLKALYRNLEQQTTALEWRALELERANVELTRSNADLRQFAYVASHDLQEPLRQVASFTQLLARRYQGRLDDDADEFIGYVVDGAQRMQRLIQALLSFSRIGTRGRVFVATDCNRLLDRVLTDLEITIQESGAVITRQPLPTVNADGDQLSLVFQNLLSNAIKFRDRARRPEINVRAEKKNGDWIFSVRDNGVGIAPEFFERIFVIFQRLHNTTDYPGTGIGLAICKRVIDRHDGRIWVESRPGRGSTFFFTLPGENTPSFATSRSAGRFTGVSPT